MYIEKPKKRIKSKGVQKKYFDSHPIDEWEFWINGRVVKRDHVHEIVHGSRKTYEDWNMIALSALNHDRAHYIRSASYSQCDILEVIDGEIKSLTKRELFIAKIRSGSKLPCDIIREFDLEEYYG